MLMYGIVLVIIRAEVQQTGKLNTYYAMSPNDAANNYYLYNVANVFYDAIDLENTTKDQEMQLFINTLIGAYEFSYWYTVCNGG